MLTLQTFASDDEAVALANGTDYGLGGVCYGGTSHACRVAERVRTGFVWVNSFGIRDLEAPFGGIRRSGIGREGGDWSFDFFCDVKDVVVPKQPFRASEAARPDVAVIFDTHWFTTGYHLADGGERYRGTYVSDEMPWYLHGVPYDYRGHPRLALEIEAVARERGGHNRAIRHPDLPRHYPTINLVKHLRVEVTDTPVLSSSSCQNCDWRHFLASGEAVGEAIRRSGLRVVLLASGA